MGQNGVRAGPGGQQGPPGNHALQDYQMQLMLLEQQNKKRLMMARQEQDAIRPDGQGGPGGPGMGPNGPNFQQGTSPQSGPRSVNSPNPSEQMKRGTPHMNNPGIPSPLPEGQNRGSPSTMNFNMGQGGQMDAGMAPQFYKMEGMNNNMMANGMRPPSSHPTFNPQGMSQQQMMIARQQAGNWQNGPNGGAPMVTNPAQGPPQAMGTPQQRNMPPPAAPANASANGRTQPPSPQGSTAAPPTPQQSNKANPKKKNETKENKDKGKFLSRATKKGSAANLAAGATPSADPSQDAATPAPATPITPVHTKTFNNGSNPNGAVQPVNGQPMASAPNAGVSSSQADPMSFPMNDPQFDMLEFQNPMGGNTDVLTDFDFDSFLNDSTGGADDNYNFDPSGFLGDNEISETHTLAFIGSLPLRTFPAYATLDRNRRRRELVSFCVIYAIILLEVLNYLPHIMSRNALGISLLGKIVRWGPALILLNDYFILFITPHFLFFLFFFGIATAIWDLLGKGEILCIYH
ncbi:hypothetical protein EYC84_010782 [Monilinia fructicola]|uniref:Uncharacterized protein n=1 Tax=Monilinia fructicola TaxID=38448 RepID=A0A5M9J6A4_MONFR|nr:hypothetical protein EYC84_010782 [Monilinia fructicola]